MEFILNNIIWYCRIYYLFKGKIDYKDFINLLVCVIVIEVDKNLMKFEFELEKVVYLL